MYPLVPRHTRSVPAVELAVACSVPQFRELAAFPVSDVACIVLPFSSWILISVRSPSFGRPLAPVILPVCIAVPEPILAEAPESLCLKTCKR